MKQFLLLFALLVSVLVGPAQGRIFTNTAGKTLEAEIVRTNGDSVTLRLKNKRTTTIKIATLSEADQDYVKEWLANQVPRLRFTPNMVRSNKADRYEGSYNTSYRSSTYVQTRELKIDVVNDENTKGLEDSTMKYILIGRSVGGDKNYKIMAIQTAKFTVAASGKTTIPFKTVKSSYYDSKYSKYRRGYKLMGYVLIAERDKDQREVFTYTSSPLFKDTIYSIADLRVGEITDETFIKKEAADVIVPGIGGEGRPRRPDPADIIVVE